MMSRFLREDCQRDQHVIFPINTTPTLLAQAGRPGIEWRIARFADRSTDLPVGAIKDDVEISPRRLPTRSACDFSDQYNAKSNSPGRKAGDRMADCAFRRSIHRPSGRGYQG